MKVALSSKEMESYNTLYNTIINSRTYKTLCDGQEDVNNDNIVLVLDTLTNIIKDIDEPLEDIINTLQGNIRQDNVDLVKDLVDALIGALIKDSNRRYIMTNIIYIAYMLKKYINK
jgi:hypothetical protein